ncbi:MAG: glycosyltransferase [Proteobacteria bacterium]|nr:glycosyltransferase [Pseudomonadota bacterium]
MRIAIFNPYKKKFAAENAADSAYKKIKSLDGIAIKIESFCDCDEIVNFAPDFIISHSSFAPKFCAIPTYVIFNEPTTLRLKSENDIRAYLTFDGYLTQSEVIAQAIRDMCFAYQKECNLLTSFVNSCASDEFSDKVNFTSPRLAYFGNNWEVMTGGVSGKKQPRFQKLFTILTAQQKVDFLELYGKKTGWSWIKNQNYVKGEVDFENSENLLDVYRSCGIGLALTSHDFYSQGLANNRIYEIVASGALCIADDVEFYRDIFGDSLLYVTSRDEQEMAEQISAHVSWAQKNSDAAKIKAKKAHEIFCQHLSVEKMLKKLIDFHAQILEKKSNCNLELKPLISVIVRSGGRSKEMVSQTLESLTKQHYKNIELIFVLYKSNDELYDLAKSYEKYFSKLSIIQSSSNIRSSVILEGIKAVTGEYIALLDDDDFWYPDHALKMVQFFNHNKSADFVYSGRVYKSFLNKVEELPGAYLPNLLDSLYKLTGKKSSYNLGGFGKTDYKEMMYLNHPIHPCFMFKKSSLTEKIFSDPLIHDCEDLYLTALMYAEGLKFSWMPELTVQMNIHNSNSKISSVQEVEIKNRIALRVLGIATWKELLNLRQREKQVEKIAKKLIKLRERIAKIRDAAKSFFDIFKSNKIF